MNRARITSEVLDLTGLVAATERPDCGAVATFAGVVRDHHDGRRVLALRYHAHDALAESTIREIEQDLEARPGVEVCRIRHRVGALVVGEVAVIVVVRAHHRREAFAAAADAIDLVKQRVPIWKEETYDDHTTAFLSGCRLPSPGEVR